MIVSNTTMQGFQEVVRQNALDSFEFFANTVMASNLASQVCEAFQSAFEEQEDVVLHTTRPRALAVAVHAWLNSRGIAVLSSAELPQHEILHWLEFLGQEGSNESAGVTIQIDSQSVGVTWL